MGFAMDPGEMRESVVLKSRTVTPDAAGHDTITWSAVGTVRAKRVPQRAAERFAATQMQSDVWDRFIIRRGPAVTDQWRLEWGDYAYDIVGVTPLPDRMWVELICRRGVKDGR